MYIIGKKTYKLRGFRESYRCWIHCQSRSPIPIRTQIQTRIQSLIRIQNPNQSQIPSPSPIRIQIQNLIQTQTPIQIQIQNCCLSFYVSLVEDNL